MTVAAALYHSYLLPWTQIKSEAERLKKFVIIALLISFVLGVVMPFLPVAKVDKNKVQELPPRLAQLVLEKKKPKPPPAPIVKKEKKKEKKKVEKKKPKPKKKPKEKPKPKPKPKPKKTQAQITAEARKKAQSAGLLAFADELSDLRETPIASKLNKSAKLSRGGTTKSNVKRSILTSNVVSGSGGINTSDLSSGVGRSSLDGRETTQVESEIDKIAAAGGTLERGSSGGPPSRTVEDVKIVMDRNKGAIYSIYNRFLRRDPSLEGKIVFELTIDPSGAVTAIKVLSSDLNSPKLERKLTVRIRSFNFGAKDVAVTVVEFPVDFLPS